MNSANEALYFGVPLVVVPQRGDQHLVGARIAELGAGVVISPGDVDAARLRGAVEAALFNPELRQGAQALGASLRESGGYRRAADAIQAFARSRA
jgi:UDP:flavonoid glycosyltransferase YjiC (YdhE family)